MKNYQMEFTRSGVINGDPEGVLNWSERWPNFTPFELSSKGDGTLIVNYEALDCLQRLRNFVRVPLIVSSAYRDPEYNREVGGAEKSLHLQGRAYDLIVKGKSDAAIVMMIYYATKAGFTGFGMYLDRTVPFIHFDTGKPRSWQTGQSRLDDTDDVTEVMDMRL